MFRFIARRYAQAYLELLIVLPLLLLLLAGLMYFGRVFYVKLAVEAASYDCARTLAESLDPDQARFQAAVSARRTVYGFLLNPAAAEVRFYETEGAWGRGRQVVCAVGYDAYVGNIPFVEWVRPGGTVRVRAFTAMRVEKYKSRWR